MGSATETTLSRPSGRVPRVCTIAGSDSGGGAGVQADLKTIISLGAYGLSVITAITAQSTVGVMKDGIHYVPTEMIRRQLVAVDDDISVDAWKVGMLGSAAAVTAVAEELKARKHPNQTLVLDPVMVTTSGSLLLEKEAVMGLVSELFPLCTVVTPNLPEAEAILQNCSGQQGVLDLSSLMGMILTAKAIAEIGGSCAVLLKGGHQKMETAAINSALRQMGIESKREDGEAADSGNILLGGADRWEGRWDGVTVTAYRTDRTPWSRVLTSSSQASSQDVVVDILFQPKQRSTDSSQISMFIAPFSKCTSTHGTGCTLSSAIATHLARGEPLLEACRLSILYVQAAMTRGISDLGKGPGVLDHGCTQTWRGALAPGLSAGGPITYPFCIVLLSTSLPSWQDYIYHPFLKSLIGEETIETPRKKRSTSKAFTYFLIQDYHFLLHFSRAYALLASSASSFAKAEHYATQALGFAREADLHVRLCERFGLKRDVLQATPEGPACIAYTRWVLDIVRKEGEIAALTAMLPCILGYAEAGKWLGEELQNRQTKIASSDEADVQTADFQSALDDWIAQYASDEFAGTARGAAGTLEDMIARDPISPSKMSDLQEVWKWCVAKSTYLVQISVAVVLTPWPSSVRSNWK